MNFKFWEWSDFSQGYLMGLFVLGIVVTVIFPWFGFNSNSVLQFVLIYYVLGSLLIEEKK